MATHDCSESKLPKALGSKINLESQSSEGDKHKPPKRSAVIHKGAVDVVVSEVCASQQIPQLVQILPEMTRPSLQDAAKQFLEERLYGKSIQRTNGILREPCFTSCAYWRTGPLGKSKKLGPAKFFVRK